MIIIESLKHINIPTKDLKKSIEFYTQFLDFELQQENEDTAIVVFDQFTFKIIKAENVLSESARNRMPLCSFVMDIDDFTEAIQEIEANEIPIVQGLSEITNGENIILADPGDNLIELYYQEL